MTNEELNQAIDTAAKFSTEGYGYGERGKLMLNHLKSLLDLQLKRALENNQSAPRPPES